MAGQGGRSAEAAPSPAWERVVLVGFMGSGKSTVGRLLAERLGWSFVDLDDEIEARAGATVAELFRDRGEAAFRALEAEAGAAALARRRVVVAPGGGWSVAPGRLDALPEGSLTVWLEVTPETAVRRAAGGGRIRPLLREGDAIGRARQLLRDREPAYRRARLHLAADEASPAALAETIIEHMGRTA